MLTWFICGGIAAAVVVARFVGASYGAERRDDRPDGAVGFWR